MAMLRRGIDTQQTFYPGTYGNQTARNFMPERVAAAQQMMGMPPQQTQDPMAAPMQEQAPKSANRPQSQGFRPKRKKTTVAKKKTDNTLRDARTAADVVGTVAGTATTAANAALAAAPAAAAGAAGAGAGAALSAVPVVGPILGGIAALASFGIAEAEKKKAAKEARRQEAFGALQNTLQSRFS